MDLDSRKITILARQERLNDWLSNDARTFIEVARRSGPSSADGLRQVLHEYGLLIGECLADIEREQKAISKRQGKS
jgi:hypothetical protein